MSTRRAAATRRDRRVAAHAGQIAWLKSQGLPKNNIRIEDLIDKRYALTTASK